MYIDGNPILHIIDEATRFQAAKWLRDLSAKHTWETLQYCWMDTYLGPPDLVNHDAGKNFISKEFRQYTTRLATVRSGPDRGLFWRLLKRLDCTVQSFVGLDWTVPKDRTVRHQ